MMAANTKKRLSGLCKTYRADPEDNVGVAELEYIKCITNIHNTQLLLFQHSVLFKLAGRLSRQLETTMTDGPVIPVKDTTKTLDKE